MNAYGDLLSSGIQLLNGHMITSDTKCLLAYVFSYSEIILFFFFFFFFLICVRNFCCFQPKKGHFMTFYLVSIYLRMVPICEWWCSFNFFLQLALSPFHHPDFSLMFEGGVITDVISPLNLLSSHAFFFCCFPLHFSVKLSGQRLTVGAGL